ncbi:MAG: hypothetical protein IIB78_08935, partial [Proteobacteria bacterium]|nr:hypothetical protein [Pseudomonadota bacterium]
IAGIKIMTTIIIVATISSIGYHYGVLQRAVGGLAWVMKRSMGVSGVESLAAAANVFFGQTEAPLLVRPYLSKMSQSELMALMTGGFASSVCISRASMTSVIFAARPHERWNRLCQSSSLRWAKPGRARSSHAHIRVP